MDRAILDIKATIIKHKDVIKGLLPAHALSGCDTEATYFGIGKGTVIKTLTVCHDLSAIGNPAASNSTSNSIRLCLLWHEEKFRYVAY
jgi:hypothetical protein